MGSMVAANLLDDHVDLVTVLHVELLGGLGLVKSFTVEEEADVGGSELSEGDIRFGAGSRRPSAS